MASEIIDRDGNRVTVGAAVTDDANEDVTMLRTDTSTKRLLAEVASTTLPSTSDPTGKIDENRVHTIYAVTDDANEDVVPVSVDSNGFILCDIVEE